MSSTRSQQSGLAARLALAAFALILAVSAIEVMGRLFDVDFSRSEARWRDTPIYYRRPLVPIGPVFVRRAGPDRWVGPVLRGGLESAGFQDPIYDDEAPVVIEYDEFGFRNPDNQGHSIQFISSQRVVLVRPFSLRELEAGSYEIILTVNDLIQQSEVRVSERFKVAVRNRH